LPFFFHKFYETCRAFCEWSSRFGCNAVQLIEVSIKDCFKSYDFSCHHRNVRSLYLSLSDLNTIWTLLRRSCCIQALYFLSLVWEPLRSFPRDQSHIIGRSWKGPHFPPHIYSRPLPLPCLKPKPSRPFQKLQDLALLAMNSSDI